MESPVPTAAAPLGHGRALSTAHPALHCRIAGALISIECLPLPLAARLAQLLQPFVVAPADAEPLLRLQVARRGRGLWSVHAADGPEEVAGRIGRILAHLEWRAVSAAVGATSGCAVIHGATLAQGSSSVLLLAPSGAGKTTLTLGLMGRGWEPYADDLSLVDAATLAVTALPRCFHVDGASLALLPTLPELESAGTLAGYLRPRHWAAAARQPQTIVLVERDPQRRSALSPMTQAEAAGALLGGAIRNQLSHSQLARIAVRLAAHARGCFRLNNGALAEALDLIEAASAG